ncbi:MAG: two-component sensor histidine kinase [unclassified Hahellaceae]|nr:two-component sensor histidine kinase [Hahellaceae bacterium]|tara:strand:+ start:21415 stop:22851 length:1437 start_codon:yes stop_codon:yes gene_type:complete
MGTLGFARVMSAVRSPARLTAKSAHEGIQRRLIKVFALQAALVSAATMLGVYTAYIVAEQVLVRQALEGEAAHFREMREANPDFQLPYTQNMRVYLKTLAPEPAFGDLAPSVEDPTAEAEVPDELAKLEPGYGRVELHGREPLVLVTDEGNQRLYLVFREDQISKLAFFFGVAPLTLVLILIYTASWFTFRQSQRVISPVSNLARLVEDSTRGDAGSLGEVIQACRGENADIDSLVQALTHYSERIAGFITRERNFTRDASHELRTPLSVIKACVDVLQQPGANPERNPELIQRIRDTVLQMEGIIETLLRLARESDVIRADGIKGEQALVDVGAVIRSVLQQTQKALKAEHIEVRVHEQAQLTLMAEETALRIIFGNLLKNALTYSAGAPAGSASIEVTIGRDRVVIADSGVGMSQAQMERAFEPFYRVRDERSAEGLATGYGLGLSIVSGLCSRFGYRLDAESAEGEGTTMTIHFS